MKSIIIIFALISNAAIACEQFADKSVVIDAIQNNKLDKNLPNSNSCKWANCVCLDGIIWSEVKVSNNNIIVDDAKKADRLSKESADKSAKQVADVRIAELEAKIDSMNISELREYLKLKFKVK